MFELEPPLTFTSRPVLFTDAPFMLAVIPLLLEVEEFEISNSIPRLSSDVTPVPHQT